MGRSPLVPAAAQHPENGTRSPVGGHSSHESPPPARLPRPRPCVVERALPRPAAGQGRSHPATPDRTRDRQRPIPRDSAEQPRARRPPGRADLAFPRLRGGRVPQSQCPRLQARAAGVRAPHGRRPGRVGLLLRRPRRADRRAQLPAAGRHRAARRGRSARRGHRPAGGAARACRPGASTRPHLHHRRLPQRPLRGARAIAQRQRPGRDGGAGCPHRLLRRARRGRRGRPDRRQQHLHASPRHRAALRGRRSRGDDEGGARQGAARHRPAPDPLGQHLDGRELHVQPRCGAGAGRAQAQSAVARAGAAQPEHRRTQRVGLAGAAGLCAARCERIREGELRQPLRRRRGDPRLERARAREPAPAPRRSARAGPRAERRCARRRGVRRVPGDRALAVACHPALARRDAGAARASTRRRASCSWGGPSEAARRRPRSAGFRPGGRASTSRPPRVRCAPRRSPWSP